jgi:hypothetical protein
MSAAPLETISDPWTNATDTAHSNKSSTRQQPAPFGSLSLPLTLIPREGKGSLTLAQNPPF